MNNLKITVTEGTKMEAVELIKKYDELIHIAGRTHHKMQQMLEYLFWLQKECDMEDMREMKYFTFDLIQHFFCNPQLIESFPEYMKSHFGKYFCSLHTFFTAMEDSQPAINTERIYKDSELQGTRVESIQMELDRKMAEYETKSKEIARLVEVDDRSNHYGFAQVQQEIALLQGFFKASGQYKIAEPSF